MKMRSDDRRRGSVPPASLRAAEVLIKRALINDPGPLPPVFLSAFLSCCWHRHLARQHALHGYHSAIWRQLEMATAQLLWSMAPRPEEADRIRLKTAIDNMVPHLKQALGDCRHSHTETFVKHLAEWHIAILRTGSPPELSPELRGRLEGTVPMLLLAPEYEHYLDAITSNEIEAVELKEPTIGDLRASLDTTHS